MTLACGIDLGIDGALAVVDCEARRLTHLWDMPVYEKKRGKGMRRVIDPRKLYEYIQTLVDIGTVLFTIEEPGYRGGQMGSGTVGWGAGLVVMAVVSCGGRYEMAAPNAWKANLRVHGPKSVSTRRAKEIFPVSATWFQGPRGGEKDGRAEAALIAEYGIVRHLGIRR
jgi:hypothetical protein